MGGGFTGFWAIIAITYFFLTIRNLQTYRKIRSLTDEGGDLHITESGIVAGRVPEELSIDVLKMFKSVFRIDLIALLIGCIAAILSLLTV